MRFQIVCLEEAKDVLPNYSGQSSFSAIDRHPISGRFGRTYYPLVFGEKRRDRSFVVMDGGRPAAVVICCDGEGALDWYGSPMQVFTRPDTALDPALAAAIMNQVEKLAGEGVATTAAIIEECAGSQLSALGATCLSRAWHGTLRVNGTVDLARGEEGLRLALRKSSKSLVNWGRKNINWSFVNQGNPDSQAFEDYHRFHRHVAGHTTRPDSTWDAMFDWIASGGGELMLGRLDGGDLVAGTVVLDGTTVAYYSSGVYDRDRFDKPMGHYPVYESILRAGERGMSVFDLGDIPQAGQGSAKDQAIGFFKRGFAGELQTSITWSLTRPRLDMGDTV